MTEMTSAGSLTVGIGTRNRPEALVRCLRSLALAGDLVAEVIVVDDGSDLALEPLIRDALGADAPPGLRFIRFDASRNVAAGRNAIAQAASTPWVLNLDDDAFLVAGEAIRAAVRVLERDPAVAAVAFAQGDEEGRPWPAASQPAPVDYACYVPTFVGYAHLLRRDAFLAVGGFREQLGINGEEKELALRLLDAGWRIVYLPEAIVGHVAAMSGRDPRRYLHQTVRNSTFSAIYNEPFPLVIFGALERLRRYFPMRKGWRIHDPGGFRQVVGDVVRGLPEAWRQRHPVRWSTIREWRRLTGSPPEPYAGPGTP